jgi:hypothetical protein
MTHDRGGITDVDLALVKEIDTIGKLRSSRSPIQNIKVQSDEVLTLTHLTSEFSLVNWPRRTDRQVFLNADLGSG